MDGVRVSEDIVLFPYVAEFVSIVAKRAKIDRVPLSAYPTRKMVDVTKTDNFIALELSV